jgi:hypothetical protein
MADDAGLQAGKDTKLTVEIHNSEPIEVGDFTESLLALGEEYKRVLARTGNADLAGESSLYITEIRNGSIIADFIPYAPALMPFMNDANTLICFAAYLKYGYSFLLGRAKDLKPEETQVAEKIELEIADYENLVKIVEPVAKDKASQYNVSVYVKGNLVNNLQLNSIEASAAQNEAKRYIGESKQPKTGIQENVVIYWHQARNDPKSRAGDRAVVESIYPSPVRAIFISDGTKAQFLATKENPFRSAYLADVSVETIKGKPAVYKIIEIHDKVDHPREARARVTRSRRAKRLKR